MTKKTGLTLFLVAIVVISGIVLGGQAQRRSTVTRHLAAAETSLAQSDYQGAINSFEAALAAGADPATTQPRLAQAKAMAAVAALVRQVEEHTAAGRYTLALAAFAQIPQDNPAYEQAHQLIVQDMIETQNTVASLAENWNVTKDPEAGRFSLTVPGAGTATLTIETIDIEGVGDAICNLEYESPSGTRHRFPNTLIVVRNEEFPAAILSSDVLLVQGQHLWRPAAASAPAYPDAKGFVVGWSVSPAGTMGAASFLQHSLTEDQQPTVATYALDLATLQTYLLSEYKIGESFPYEWYNYYPITFRWPADGSLAYTSLDGAAAREVTWRRP